MRWSVRQSGPLAMSALVALLALAVIAPEPPRTPAVPAARAAAEASDCKNASAAADGFRLGGGGSRAPHGPHDCIPPAERAKVESRIAANRSALGLDGDSVVLQAGSGEGGIASDDPFAALLYRFWPQWAPALKTSASGLRRCRSDPRQLPRLRLPSLHLRRATPASTPACTARREGDRRAGLRGARWPGHRRSRR